MKTILKELIDVYIIQCLQLLICYNNISNIVIFIYLGSPYSVQYNIEVNI